MVFFNSYFVTLGLCALTVLLMIVYYWNRTKAYSEFPSYPMALFVIYCYLTRKMPKDIPFNCFLFQKFIEVFKRYEKEGLCLIWAFQPLLFIFSEEPIKVFSNEQAAINKSYKYEVVEDMLGAGLVTSNGERWKKHRKIINPVFRIGMLKEKIPIFNENAAILVKEMQKLIHQPAIDLIDILKRCYFSNVCESIIGLKAEDEESKDIVEEYLRIVNHVAEMTVYRLGHPWFHWRFVLYLCSSGRKYIKTYKEYRNFTRKILLRMKENVIARQSKERSQECNRSNRKSFAHVLMEHHLKDPSITMEDLEGEVNTFIVSGYDTVSYTTMVVLFMLGHHPEIQEKAFNEVQRTAGGYITLEEINSFAYLEAVILETLRIYPMVPVYARQLTKDVQCGKYKVPRNTSIVFFPYTWHRNAEIYPDPERFDPERFLNQDSKKPWMYIPFSEGIRNCIGKKFALMEMKVVLAYALRNFEVKSLDKREDLKFCWDIVLTPVNPIRMSIKPRKASNLSAD